MAFLINRDLEFDELQQSSVNQETAVESFDVAPLIYPPEMRGDLTRPCVEFTAHQREQNGQVNRHHIWFPAPANIAINDGAEYGQADLGATVAGFDLLSKNKSVGDIASEILDINKTQLAALSLKALPVLNESSSLVTQSIMNPNTNTTFNSNNVRTFSFAFKMVARSQAESDLIRQIQTKFRHYVYASKGGDNNTITLEYPPVWTIKFMNMDSGTENPFLPRIYSCYCTSVNTNFNSTGNVYLTDNAPLEVDLEIQFQETRALNRHDIEQMEDDKLGNRGIDSTGRPKVNTNLAQPDPAPTKGG